MPSCILPGQYITPECFYFKFSSQGKSSESQFSQQSSPSHVSGIYFCDLSMTWSQVLKSQVYSSGYNQLMVTLKRVRAIVPDQLRCYSRGTARQLNVCSSIVHCHWAWQIKCVQGFILSVLFTVFCVQLHTKKGLFGTMQEGYCPSKSALSDIPCERRLHW